MHLLRVGLLLIPGFSLGKEIEECCKRKIVGDDIYNFIKQVGEAKSEFGCMNDCVYSIEGKPDSMFCFRSGDQRAVCQDSSDSTDSTDSTGSTDLTDLTDECFIDENTDYPGMDLNPETGRTTDRRDSALACRDLCNQNKDCKYFGWKAHSRECWLKTGISKKVVQIGTTSGTACRTECLPGWSQFELKCYKIFEEKKPWKEAQAICQEEGSNLASVISNSNNNFIEELIVKTPVEYPWIGASLFSSELKEFKWIDGPPFVYENWDTDQPIYNPRETCVEFVNGKWHDFPCDFPRAFICQKFEGTLVFEKKQEFILTRNNKLGEVDFLGEEYTITFQLLLTAGTPAPTSSTAGSIIHFTIGGDCCGVPGDRTPGLWVYNGTEIVLRSTIDGQANYGILPGQFPDLPAISLTTWHTVEISQLSNGSEIVFYMKLDGSTIATKINNQPRSFKNVKIFAGDDWYDAAFGKMKHLIVKTKL